MEICDEMKKSKKNPPISVVVPMYNAEKFIEDALASILETDYPNYEVVVVDDLSTDGGFTKVRRRYSKNPKVRITRNKKKLLAAGSRNRGVRLASGEYIALLDHDVLVDKNWLKEAMAVFKKYPNAGIVQGVVLDIRRKNIIQHAGIKINSFFGWVTTLGVGEDIKKYRLVEKEVFANATGLIFKKEAWRKVGGYDERLAINVDDWDFNWRVWLYGYSEILAPKSITYHWSKKQNVRDAWIKRVNWEFHFAKVPWLFIKNYEALNVLRFLPTYLAVGLARGLFNLVFRFNPATIIGYFRAVIWVIVNGADLSRRRREVQTKRKIPDKYLLDHLMDRNFLFSYFQKNWLPASKSGKMMNTERFGDA